MPHSYVNETDTSVNAPMKRFSNTFSWLMNWILIYIPCWLFIPNMKSSHGCLSWYTQKRRNLQSHGRSSNVSSCPRHVDTWRSLTLTGHKCLSIFQVSYPFWKHKPWFSCGDNQYVPTGLRSLNWWIHRSVKHHTENFIPMITFIVIDHYWKCNLIQLAKFKQTLSQRDCSPYFGSK